MVTEKGCMALADALRANPSHLRALDMSYNHPGEAGTSQLTKGQQDPLWRLECLWYKHKTFALRVSLTGSSLTNANQFVSQ